MSSEDKNLGSSEDSKKPVSILTEPDMLSKQGLVEQPDNGAVQLQQIKSTPEILKKTQQMEYASVFYGKLEEYINEFERKLGQEHETGIRLVSFGQNIQFAVRKIGYYNPKLICFYGELEDGSQVQLIQHVNQISFLLMALKRKNPGEPRRSIGFDLDVQKEVEEKSASDRSGEEVMQ